MVHLSWEYVAHRAEVWERTNGRFDVAVKIQEARKALGVVECQMDTWPRPLDDAARRMT